MSVYENRDYVSAIPVKMGFGGRRISRIPRVSPVMPSACGRNEIYHLKARSYYSENRLLSWRLLLNYSFDHIQRNIDGVPI